MEAYAKARELIDAALDAALSDPAFASAFDSAPDFSVKENDDGSIVVSAGEESMEISAEDVATACRKLLANAGAEKKAEERIHG